MSDNLPALRPACPKGHGRMTLRPLDVQTYEQLWTGPWYDCTNVEHGHRCLNSATLMTDEAKAYAEATKKAARA